MKNKAQLNWENTTLLGTDPVYAGADQFIVER
jgi:hypothetical protein